MATQQQPSQANGRTYDFKPVEFDAETMEPDAFASAQPYMATIDSGKVGKTGKDSFPMVILEWKLDSTEDEAEEAQASIGAVVADFLTFFPEGDRRGKMGKARFRLLCEKLEIPYDIVPKQLKSKADFEEFLAKVIGASLPVWITSKEDKEGVMRTSVHLDEPKGGGVQLAPLDEGEEEEPARKPVAAKKTAAKKTARR